MKFKVGDKVKVVGNDVPLKDDYIRHRFKIGEIVEITEVSQDDCTCTNGDIEQFVSKVHLAPVNKNKERIIITVDDRTTTAVYITPDGKKKIGKAVCSTEDEFDLAVGAKIAIDRALETVDKTKAEPKCKYDPKDKFHYGDKVKVPDGRIGTVVCKMRSCSNTYGVEFDSEALHDFGAFSLAWGRRTTGNRGEWFPEPMLTIATKENDDKKESKPTRRFKVGDRVRCKSRFTFCPCTGTVSSLRPWCYNVHVDGHADPVHGGLADDGWGFRDSELEPLN